MIKKKSWFSGIEFLRLKLIPRKFYSITKLHLWPRWILLIWIVIIIGFWTAILCLTLSINLHLILFRLKGNRLNFIISFERAFHGYNLSLLIILITAILNRRNLVLHRFIIQYIDIVLQLFFFMLSWFLWLIRFIFFKYLLFIRRHWPILTLFIVVVFTFFFYFLKITDS